jgi:RecA/RadA recombinase
MARKKKEEESKEVDTSVSAATEQPVEVPPESSDSVPAEPKPEPEKSEQVEEAEQEKKGKKTKTEVDPFDAWMEAAKDKWKGSIDTVANLSPDGTPRMSTGNFVLDRLMYGGHRRGRLYRYWGRPKSAKTGSALNCAEYFTSNHCGNCFEHRLVCKCNDKQFRYAKMMYIDVEGRVLDNRPWIEAHGIHPDRIAMVAPKGGEQVVDMADAALRSNVGIGLIIVDSVAQMISQDEMLKPAEKGKTIGRGAMLINSALRKWVCSIVSKDIKSTVKPTIILINQIRNKTDSMGCFHQDTPVMFADGSQHRIKDVVDQELTGPVLSWDGAKIVERKITAWHDNGDLDEGEEWLTFRVAGTGGRRGAIGFTCTPKHVLVTEDGREVPAAEVRVGDRLLSWYETSLSNAQKDVITGSLLGDGHLHATDGRETAASLVLANGVDNQLGYFNWKLNMLRTIGIKRRPSANGRVAYVSNSSFELGLLRQKFYKPQAEVDGQKNYRLIPLDLLKSASLLTLAVWYMDDGSYKESHRNASISVKRLSHEDGKLVAQELSHRYPVSYSEAQQAIVFSTESFLQFSKDIAGFVPSCMSYKLRPEHQIVAGLELHSISPHLADPERAFTETGRKTIGAKVLSIRISPKKMRSKKKYDITIEENSFYVVGGDTTGVVVHNSPDVMPGGLGQEFASACDIKFTKRQKHYLIPNDKGGFEDKVVKFGDGGFSPEEDDTADFVEIECKVTESGICPAGRYGTFNYWQRAGHGRRCGDVDNVLWLWEYAKKYQVMQKLDKGGYKLEGLEARTQKELEAQFSASPDIQGVVWERLIELTNKR